MNRPQFLWITLFSIGYIVFIFLIRLSFFQGKVAGTSQVVTGTVKISVCGNGVVEGSEDCEGTYLNGKTCQSLGYTSGTLTCDISCSFNTSQCLIAPSNTPTPPPQPSNTPTPAPVASPTSSSTSIQLPHTTPIPFITTPTSALIAINNPTSTAIPQIPTTMPLLKQPTSVTPKHKTVKPQFHTVVIIKKPAVINRFVSAFIQSTYSLWNFILNIFSKNSSIFRQLLNGIKFSGH